MLRFGLIIAVVIFAADQASKWWIVESVMQPPRTIEVTSFFNLVLAYNRGVSFSFFNSESASNPYIFSALALAIVIGLILWLRRIDHRLPGLAVGLVIGGAAGNTLDRLRFGGVVDFIDLHLGVNHWPAFNVADSAIVVGAALLIIDALFRRRESPK